MKTNLFLICAIGALLCSGVALKAADGNLSGEVVALRAVDGGTATSLKIRRAGTGQLDTADKGSSISPLDGLVTDANTIAQINFKNGIALVMGINTDITLSERKESAEGIQTKIFLTQGILRSKTLASASKAGFQIDTKEVLVTHKGSETIIKVEENSDGKWVATIVQIQPSSLVTSKGTGETLSLSDIGAAGTFLNNTLRAILTAVDQLNKLRDQVPWMVKEEKLSSAAKTVNKNAGTGESATFIGSGSGGGTFTITDQRPASP